MAERQAHLKRWVTGLAGLAVLIVCVAWGGIVLSGLVALACLVCLWEYFRIVCPPGTRVLTDPLLVAGYGFGVGLIAAAHSGRPELVALAAALNVLCCGLISVFRFSADRAVLELVARQIQGLCYIPLPLALLILLRLSPEGTTWVFLLCAVIFAGDTAALYAGTAWGRRKLSPAISPGKTVEGAAAGLAANLVVALIGKWLFLPALDWGSCLLFALAAGIMGQVGDLFESQMKRVSNVKDSGAILPGHGGVLDRIDALLFAAPVAYLFRMGVVGA
ncbi:MAG: phosphatidate cytidylyltransferase [Desulfobacterales bacterium]|jgi:phosphatidate cytidylyltransferase|nr:phosphatidate cytidylyltransferase [Desulfobacterales bacterium]